MREYQFHADKLGVWTHHDGDGRCFSDVITAIDKRDASELLAIAETAIKVVEAEGDYQEEGYEYEKLRLMVLNYKRKREIASYVPPETAKQILSIDDDTTKQKQD